MNATLMGNGLGSRLTTQTLVAGIDETGPRKSPPRRGVPGGLIQILA